MKKTANRVIVLILSLLLATAFFTAVPLTASAEESNPYHASGNCGTPNEDKVQWYVFHDGSVAFFGSEGIKDYLPQNGEPTAPWYVQSPLQTLTSTKISIEDGVTSVGAYAFYIPVYYTGYLFIRNIDLPESLTSIGAHAFENQNKMEKITISRYVRSIGPDAFKGCKKLAHIDFYGDPSELEWADDTTPFTQQVTCHIKPQYADQIEALETKYAAKHVKFEANLYYDNSMVENGIKRNIRGEVVQEHSGTLGGAAPFVVVGTFSGAKKSVTHGNNGFASVVRIDNNGTTEYYVHTNNNSRSLNKATTNSLTGVVTSLSATDHDTLKLETRWDYIGPNIVRLKYTLENTGAPIDNVMLGGTGDIKIGADDYAAIKPMKNDSDQTIGFYMSSAKDYDKDSAGKYATLGFIGKKVELNDNGDKSPDATFFYGETFANKGQSAVGAYRHLLMPECVFTQNPNYQYSETFDNNKDSGLSYYWNVGTVGSNEKKEYAVLFSVYGEDTSSQDSGKGMIEELDEKYYTVTWQNYDGTLLEKQIVRKGETPEYTEAPPVKASTAKHDYEFTGWSPEIVPCTGDTLSYTYTAQFKEITRKLFAGHSLTLDGDIGVIFHLDVPVADVAVDDVKNGTKKLKVKFNWYDKESEYEIKAADFSSASGYFTAKCNVAAPEMAYNIHADLYIDGEKYTGESDDYSVRDYGMYIIEHPASFTLSLVDLAKKMLDYGAKGQVVFKRTRDKNGTAVPYANQGTGYTMEEHVITGEYPDMGAGIESSGLKYYSTSILFLSKTGMRQYYQLESGAKFESLSNKSAFGKNGTLYYLEVSDIPAYELNVKQTFNVGSAEFKYSALDYAMKLQQNGTDAQKALGTSMYWYWSAAKAYFDEISAS